MLHLYNTLSRTIEDFEPLYPPRVGMYTCGPTVYDYQHIGHMRRYMGDDILVRVLRMNGYEVNQVMNITDVGHLVSDADTGEDKMEKGARKFGLSVWDIAKKFEKQFFDSADALNIQRPNVVMHATDYIKEQIELIKTLEKKGFTYKTSDGIYFDTAKFPNYNRLSQQKPEDLKAGARIEMVAGKRNPTDFALWKFSYPNGRSFDAAADDVASHRQMEWESPWGVGFPGWHLECSTMAMKELGSSLDIHTGGIDHIAIHHTNEIAQSEAATGQPFVKYWIHHAFLLINGQKMSKSLGNLFTVEDVVKKGFNPLALRYLYLQTHYRQEMNFTWESLAAAQSAYQKLIALMINLQPRHFNDLNQYSKGQRSSLSREKLIKVDLYQKKFTEAVNDDLNTPRAVAVLWEAVKSNIPSEDKYDLVLGFDEVMGLELAKARSMKQEAGEIPNEVKELLEKREHLRKEKKWSEADIIRVKLETLKYRVKDNPDSTKLVKIDD